MTGTGIITLTTDFGLAGPYAGAMKGAALSISGDARLVDITHTVEPGDVFGGALAMLDACLYFPAGTVHVGVVDPGVGGARRPLLLVTERYFFVGPDNGLLTLAAERDGIREARHLTEKIFFLEEVSATFHGRDVFAPVAAHLLRGAEPRRFGPSAEELVRLEMPRIEKREGEILGTLIYVDRFGNLITNIKMEDVFGHLGTEKISVEVKGLKVPGLAATYSDVEKGVLAALIGSSGRLEVAANMGRASDIIGAARGEPVRVKKR